MGDDNLNKTFKEMPLLRVKGLGRKFGQGCHKCEYKINELKENYCIDCGTVYACRDISLEVFTGETVGLVGESGSGKSTILDCLYFDIEAETGEAFLSTYEEGNTNILCESAQQKKMIRNNLAGKVYQNPVNGLKMDFSALSNVAEKLIASGSRNVSKMREISTSLLTRVKISKHRIKDVPKSFSGGMQQRVQIARALSNKPSLLLLDEITNGLDLSVQARVLDLIKEIQRETDIGMIIVSHDLRVIRMLADRTYVLLNGKIIESGLTDRILEDPKHPYTQELVYSLL